MGSIQDELDRECDARHQHRIEQAAAGRVGRRFWIRDHEKGEYQ